MGQGDAWLLQGRGLQPPASGTALEPSHAAPSRPEACYEASGLTMCQSRQQVLGHSCAWSVYWAGLVNPRPELESVACRLHPGQAWPHSRLFSSPGVGKEVPMWRPHPSTLSVSPVLPSAC